MRTSASIAWAPPKQCGAAALPPPCAASVSSAELVATDAHVVADKLRARCAELDAQLSLARDDAQHRSRARARDAAEHLREIEISRAWCEKVGYELRVAAGVSDSGVEQQIDRALGGIAALDQQRAALQQRWRQLVELPMELQDEPSEGDAATPHVAFFSATPSRASMASQREITGTIDGTAADCVAPPPPLPPPPPPPPLDLAVFTAAAAPPPMPSVSVDEPPPVRGGAEGESLAECHTLHQRIHDARETLVRALQGLPTQAEPLPPASSRMRAHDDSPTHGRLRSACTSRSEVELQCLLTSMRQADRELCTAHAAIAAGHGQHSRSPRWHTEPQLREQEMRTRLVEAKMWAAQLELERDEYMMATRQLAASRDSGSVRPVTG